MSSTGVYGSTRFTVLCARLCTIPRSKIQGVPLSLSSTASHPPALPFTNDGVCSPPSSQDNLLSKFLASAQYTEVVDLEIA